MGMEDLNTSDGSYISSVNAITSDQFDSAINFIRTKNRRSEIAIPEALRIDSQSNLFQTLGEANYEPNDLKNRFHSSVLYKFTDTSPGGSYAINPKPQFTPYADIRPHSLGTELFANGVDPDTHTTTKISGIQSRGMGRYYSEAIDDNAQVIHLRFGVPAYNSMTGFLTSFYDTSAAQVARTGRVTPGLFETLGRAVGLVIQVVYVPLLLIMAIGAAARFMLQRPSSKFYYLKPTMVPYWMAVNTMVNQLAINKGIFPNARQTTDAGPGEVYGVDQTALKNMHALLPDIFAPDGSIDMFGVASKATRRRVAFDSGVADYLENIGDNNDGSYADMIAAGRNAVISSTSSGNNVKAKIQAWINTSTGKNMLRGNSKEEKNKPVDNEADIRSKADPVDKNANNALDPTKQPNGVASKIDPTSVKQTAEDLSSPKNQDSAADYFKAEMNDGTAFASFRVDFTGSSSESFTNSLVESDLSRRMNDMSASNRSASFNMANGNLGGGFIGAAVGSVFEAVGNFAKGALDSVQLSGLLSLGGSAFVDIPKRWDTSQGQLPQGNYTMTLISPYGNPISQMINIYIPLCMIICGALPLATGKQSHTSPFLCELYDKGHCQTRLGMITSLNITRGTSNLAFNSNGDAMAVDVSFTVTDLSSIVSVPIAKGFSFNPASVINNGTDGIFDEDNAYTDYLAILSSMNLSQQIYPWNKLKLNILKQKRKFSALKSPGFMMAFAHAYTPVGWLDLAYKGQTR